MSDDSISDDEILLRRIPDGKDWFEPPDRITSFNFKLRPGEHGISVYRQSLVDPQEVLEKPGAIEGSFLAWISVGTVRSLKNGAGEPLGLDVIAVNDADDPGHAEIRGPEAGKISNSAAKALQKAFRRLS